jgi:hypothetical protein
MGGGSGRDEPAPAAPPCGEPWGEGTGFCSRERPPSTLILPHDGNREKYLFADFSFCPTQFYLFAESYYLFV